jgi:putative intracellular protease/amidase
MRRKILLLARIVVYLLASVVPSVLVGVVGVKAGLADRYEGPPATSEFRSGELPAPPGHDPDKPTAVVLLSNRGSEVTDVLAPYEVLSESGAFNVYAAAPKREAATLSGGLDVLPQLSLAELDRRLEGEDPDVVVVPAMWDVGSPGHRPVAKWLKEHAEGTGTVMSVCDGAEVLADAGLLDGRRATANWVNISRWEGRYPDAEWVRGCATSRTATPAVRPWAREKVLKPVYVHADAPSGSSVSFPFDATLRDLAASENAPLARFLAKLLEYPTGHLDLAGGGWPFVRLLRPAAVGLLGLTVVVLLDRLVLTPTTRRLRRHSKGTGA